VLTICCPHSPIPGRMSSGMAGSDMFIYDVAADTWTSKFSSIQGSARSDVNGFASSNEGGSQAPISVGPGNEGGQASQVVVVTRTAANGDVSLSTRTVRVNPTRTVVITTTSTGVVVTTDSAGLTSEFTLGQEVRTRRTDPVIPRSLFHRQGHTQEYLDRPRFAYWGT
jgi:hypothetical protein